MLKDGNNTLDDRLIIIDDNHDDVCSYFYCGFDIAFFVQSNEYLLINKEDDIRFEILNDRDIESITLQFINDYVVVLRNLGVLFDDIDSFEHLLMEVNCYSLQVYLTQTHSKRLFLIWAINAIIE